MRFKDRIDAAEKLLPHLKKYASAKDTIIAAIPRGSLQMGFELHKELNLPLDIVVTKKIPYPGNEEYAIGSIGPGGEVLLNKNEIGYSQISDEYLKKQKEELTAEIKKRYALYRGTPEIPSFKGKTVILIDDGIATGFTMKAAVEYLKHTQAAKIVVAVPVSAVDAAHEIKELADEFICLDTPAFFYAVGQFYENFPQVSDEEAKKYLEKSRKT
jgi:putative phosphoribosyl transferase